MRVLMLTLCLVGSHVLGAQDRARLVAKVPAAGRDTVLVSATNQYAVQIELKRLSVRGRWEVPILRDWLADSTTGRPSPRSIIAGQVTTAPGETATDMSTPVKDIGSLYPPLIIGRVTMNGKAPGYAVFIGDASVLLERAGAKAFLAALDRALAVSDSMSR